MSINKYKECTMITCSLHWEKNVYTLANKGIPIRLY